MVPDNFIEKMAEAHWEAGCHGSDYWAWRNQSETTKKMSHQNMRAALLALESNGWRVVPVEPTDEMLPSLVQILYDRTDHNQSHNYCRDEAAAIAVYKAMLSASPNSK